MKAIISRISQVLDVLTTDPDDARRRKLLNIVLLGMFVLVLAGFLIIFVYDLAGTEEDVMVLYAAALGVLVGIVVVYVVNRYCASWVAGSMFLLILIAAFFISDELSQIMQGRSLVLFAIPIVMASVFIRPYASFLTAGAITATLIAVGFATQISPEPFALVIFVSIGLASWLSARTMEQALKDLRILNAELDMRVIERTRQLAERTDELAGALAGNQAVLDSTADGIVVFGTDSRAIVANPAAASLLGQPPEAIVGASLQSLMGEAVEAKDRETIMGLLQKKEAAEPSVKFTWGEKTLSASIAPVRLESGEELGTVTIFRDFTHEAEVDRMKSAFVSIASHDLRSPIGAILGYAGMLQAGIGGPLFGDQRAIVESIVSAAEQMRTLANNLLDRAQIEAGMFSLRVAPFSPTDLIGDLENVMGPLAENRGLDLGCHIEDDVPGELSGDRQRLQQILMNLVGNAVKFTEEGSVQVRIYLPDADHWAMTVSDTGCGIPEEIQQVIFEPFRRADDTSQADGGVGLGLSIVKQLVDLMGGEVLLESEVGKGSTFTVVLPMDLGEANTSEP